MALVKVCSTIIHPMHHLFPSKTEAGVVHTTIAGTILSDAVCTCKGWQYRESCSHVEAVEENACDWIGGRVDDYNRDIIKCPLCGAPVEEFELEPEYT